MLEGSCRTLPFAIVVLLVLMEVETSFQFEIQVGLLYDANCGGFPLAMDEEIEQANKESYTFRLSTRTTFVDALDSFNVSRALCSLLSSGAKVLMGHVGHPALDTIKAYTESLSVPFIFLNTPSHPRPDWESTTTNMQYFIQPEISKAIVDIIQTYEWSSLLYIYSTSEALYRLEQIQDFMHEYPTSPEIVARHVQNSSACMDVIRALHREDKAKNIRVILDVKDKDAEHVITSVIEDGTLYKIRFHFILPFVSYRNINLSAYKTGGVNITGFDLFSEKDFYCPPLRPSSLPWSPERIFSRNAVQVLVNALEGLLRTHGASGATHLIKNIHGWLDRPTGTDFKCQPPTSYRWGYGPDLSKVLMKTNIPCTSGNISFSKNGQRSGHSLDVIEVSMYRGRAKVGNWTEERFQPRGPELVLDKGNRTIDNRTRVVITIEDKPYNMNSTEVTDGVPLVGRERFYGYCSDLAEMVARKVGYEYHIRRVRDGHYGGPQGDGTWDGIIGELIRHEADISFAPLTITSKREKVLDFTKPFMSLGISIMIKKPGETDPHVFSFMEPLSQEIWLCTVFAFIGVSVVLFLVSRFSSEEWNVDSGEAKLSNDFTIGNSLWFSLGAFMQQGCDVLPKSVSGRIVTSVWWFFTLIIISSYTANLAAYLTTMRMSAPIKSAEDLAKQTEIKYGTLESGSTNTFFNETTVSLYQRMWSFMTSQKDVFVRKNDDGIQRVRTSHGKYAFLIESTTNEYHNNRLPCDTMKVGSNLDSKGYGVATPMGSDIRDKLTLSILELREHGKLEELKKLWWFDKSECPKEKTTKESEDNALTLSKVAGIFYILVAGLALSVISVVLEFLYKTKVDSRRQNISFGSEARSKFRLSISGHSDDESGGQRTPLRSTGTFTYTTCDGHARTSTQTVV